MARGQPRPRWRWPDLDRPARRVRPRRLAPVRSDLGPALARPAGLRAARSAQSRAALRPAPDRRRRRSRLLRGDDERPLLAVALGARPALTDPDADRAMLRRARGS